VLQVADEGFLVRCNVTGTNVAGSSTASSASISPTAPAAPGYADIILADNPSMYSRLDDLTDTSGNGHTLALDAGVITDATGLITEVGDGAQHFDNTGNTGLSTADATDLRVGAGISVEFWIEPQSTSNFWIATKDGDFKFAQVSAGTFRWTINGASSFFADCPSVSTYTTGNVYHVVGTWDTATKLMNIYINGVLDYTVDASTFGYTPTTSGWGPLRIGNNADIGGIGIADEVIDEFAVYDSVLSDADILAHYNAGTA
jgi:hypothetical protein